MPSRQERRQAERNAAKRAPAKATAAGAAGAAAALENLNVNVNQLGDWTSQTEDASVLVRALGVEVVKKMAGEGDRDAQYSRGIMLVSEAAGVAASGPRRRTSATLQCRPWLGL